MKLILKEKYIIYYYVHSLKYVHSLYSYRKIYVKYAKYM